jgi:hypothetical protein
MVSANWKVSCALEGEVHKALDVAVVQGEVHKQQPSVERVGHKQQPIVEREGH